MNSRKEIEDRYGNFYSEQFDGILEILLDIRDQNERIITLLEAKEKNQ